MGIELGGYISSSISYGVQEKQSNQRMPESNVQPKGKSAKAPCYGTGGTVKGAGVYFILVATHTLVAD